MRLHELMNVVLQCSCAKLKLAKDHYLYVEGEKDGNTRLLDGRGNPKLKIILTVTREGPG